MNRSLRTQLLVSFLTISFLIIAMFGGLTNELVDSGFQEYIHERQEEQLNAVIKRLEETYDSESGWNEEEIQSISRFAMQNGIFLSLYNTDQELIWDSFQQTGHHMMGPGMHSMMMQPLTEYIESTFPLQQNGQTVGEAVLGYQAAGYASEEVQFLQGTRRNLWIVGIAAAAVSFLLAIWIANALSRPIRQTSRFTRDIADGQYGNQLHEKTTIAELDELIHSVNDLSQQLDNQQKVRDQLSSNIAHEIRTPLTTLKGNIEAMIDGVWQPTPDKLQSCYDEVNRIARLIGNIDQLTKLDSQETVLQKGSVELKSLSQHVVSNFQSALDEKQLHITVSGNPVQLTADEDKLNQVITNLLSNAIKFTSEKGSIQIHVAKEKDMAVFRITDTGQGIRKQDLWKIFERFYMADPSRESTFGSQGIGLAITKSIVNAHNGIIHAESTYGKGSSFIVRLPVER